MSYCSNCGTKIIDNMKFCHKCGTEIIKFDSKENQIKLALFKIYDLEIENNKISREINSFFCSKIKELKLKDFQNKIIEKQREIYYPIYLMIDEIRYSVIIDNFKNKKELYYEDAYSAGYISYSLMNCMYEFENYKKYLVSFNVFYKKVLALLNKEEFKKTYECGIKVSGLTIKSFKTLEYQEKLEKYINSLSKKPHNKKGNASSSVLLNNDIDYEPWERDAYDDSYGAWLEKGGPDKEIEPYEGSMDPYDGGDFF